ncbi:hypothetical protein C1702_01815 [Caldimonas thermodepolymerans]|uniref:Uncharacterized protein n=1 Tax=Caldimonas thermodepolymerans TaxID=215580 RepID=A0A2S5T851_9BURK|nr:hypothetical protein C1702_01815 [Caldimonas thermodepolymerans]
MAGRSPAILRRRGDHAHLRAAGLGARRRAGLRGGRRSCLVALQPQAQGRRATRRAPRRPRARAEPSGGGAQDRNGQPDRGGSCGS